MRLPPCPGGPEALPARVPLVLNAGHGRASCPTGAIWRGGPGTKQSARRPARRAGRRALCFVPGPPRQIAPVGQDARPCPALSTRGTRAGNASGPPGQGGNLMNFYGLLHISDEGRHSPNLKARSSPAAISSYVANAVTLA